MHQRLKPEKLPGRELETVVNKRIPEDFTQGRQLFRALASSPRTPSENLPPFNLADVSRRLNRYIWPLGLFCGCEKVGIRIEGEPRPKASKAAELHEQGFTRSEIAKRLNVSRHHVGDLLANPTRGRLAKGFVWAIYRVVREDAA